MEYNKYQNAEFEPEFNDFDDGYNDLPSENAMDMQSVRSIKKKYIKYAPYLKAVETYNNYMESLIEKYGGNKQFGLAVLLGKVREYIPLRPKLHLNKRNKMYLKMKIDPQMLTKKEVDYDFSNIPEPSEYKGAVIKFRTSYMIRKLANEDDVSDILNKIDVVNDINELSILSLNATKKLREIQSKNISNSKKKKLLKKYARKRQLKPREEGEARYLGIQDMVDQYDLQKRNEFFGITDEDEEIAEYYKGTVLKRKYIEYQQLIDRLKAIGFRSKQLTIAQRKIIRRSKKQQAKNDKKKRKMRKILHEDDKIISRLTDCEYSDYNTYIEDMTNYKIEGRWK